MNKPDTELRLQGAELEEWFNQLELGHGSHPTPDQGMCFNEAAAWITNSAFNDAPGCVSPVIRAFTMSWQDSLGDEDRQRLVKPLLWDAIGTATGSEQVESELAWMSTDWLVRTHTPAWLRLAGLDEQADTLARLAPLNAETTPTTLPALKAVRSDADAAWAAARAAARAAAWDAAGDAARAAAWDAAWAAARAAARAAAWDAAGDAARDAAGAAAWAAARDAARAAARAAARVAARDALKPTVVDLQTSASDLIKNMCAHAKAAR